MGIMTIELAFRGSHSLKDKRMVLNRLKGRLKHRANVAVVEMEHQEAWQRGTIVAVAVGGAEARLEPVLDEVRSEIEATPGAEICWEEREYR